MFRNLFIFSSRLVQSDFTTMIKIRNKDKARIIHFHVNVYRSIEIQGSTIEHTYILEDVDWLRPDWVVVQQEENPKFLDLYMF